MDTDFVPAYLRLPPGELATRARRALAHLQRCSLCARGCHVNRLLTTRGAICRTGRQARVHSWGPHQGEERPLSGRRGSGTIFFSWCNLNCVFCQNWSISRRGEGTEVSTAELATMMLELQGRGCHNLNLVSPSHVVPQILDALALAAAQGLRLPVVYNSGGYDSPQALALLAGVVDIYLADMKFADSQIARPLVGVGDYAEVNQTAVRQMHRQVGDLVLDRTGIARRGLLVRHLVLPGNLAGTDRILEFLAREISPATYLNLMDQYRPCYRAEEFPPLDRSPSRAEYRQALATAHRLGLNRLDRP
ncbi:MAG: radical SAM protein [Desulfuromonadales bacterium]|nr:radical SAM protein [Desulfuromonadales bacterium]